MPAAAVSAHILFPSRRARAHTMWSLSLDSLESPPDITLVHMRLESGVS